MSFLIVDTCVWIELAEKPPLRALLQELQTALAQNVRQLVVPEPVVLEYQRNRTKASDSWIKSLQGHMKQLNTLKPLLEAAKDDIQIVQKAGNAEIEMARKCVPKNLEDIDRIFSGALAWEPSEPHFKDACHRTMHFKPPARTPQRSSVGDYLVWASVLEFLGQGEVWFCTANSNDFSAPERKDQPHPDLANEATQKGNSFRYFNDPTKLVEALIEELPKQEHPLAHHLPRYFDYVPAAPTTCPKCGGQFDPTGAFLNSAYGGLTLQYICRGCGFRFDTGDFFD